MKIKFKSTVKQPGADDVNVEAVLDAKKEKYEDSNKNIYDVYTFTEENPKVTTRIELNPKYVNIFRESVSLNFELNKEVNTSVIKTDDGLELTIKTFLKSFKKTKEKFKINYELRAINNQLVSECFIDISEEKTKKSTK